MNVTHHHRCNTAELSAYFEILRYLFKMTKKNPHELRYEEARIFYVIFKPIYDTSHISKHILLDSLTSFFLKK